MSPKTRIALIEDNEQNRYLITYLLSHHGYEVATANDGPQGLALLAQSDHGVSLVLLDIQLPGMDGYEVATALRARATSAALPIVAISSFAMPGDRAKAMAIGFSGYIEKPIDPDSFVEQVRFYLSGP